MTSESIYWRNLEKLRFSSKQSSMQDQMKHLCSFWTFSCPLAMMKSCSSEESGSYLHLSPAQAPWMLVTEGLHWTSLSALSVSWGARAGPRGALTALGTGHLLRIGWVRDGMGRYGKDWGRTAGPDSACLFFSDGSPFCSPFIQRALKIWTYKSFKPYSGKPGAISGWNNFK